MGNLADDAFCNQACPGVNCPKDVCNALFCPTCTYAGYCDTRCGYCSQMHTHTGTSTVSTTTATASSTLTSSSCFKYEATHGTTYLWLPPMKITTPMSNAVQSIVQSLIPEGNFQNFWATVVLSYATGNRSGFDATGTGPGMYFAAAMVVALAKAGMPCFSGLCIPAGVDWKQFLMRLQVKHVKRAAAQVLVVLQDNMMRVAVLKGLNKLNSIPARGTLLEQLLAELPRFLDLVRDAHKPGSLPMAADQVSAGHGD